MPKCLTIEPHLSVKELEVRYRQAKEPIERTRYQIVWLLAVDQAGWHTSDLVEVSEGIHLEFMPSHSPELQPLLALVASDQSANCQ